MSGAKMMKVRTLSIVVVLAAAGGCASQLQPLDEGDTEGGEGAMPVHVAEAFERACATTAGCHGDGQGPSLTATTAPAIVGMIAGTGQLPLVVPGNLQASYIAIKILPDAALDDPSLRQGDVMPPPGNEVDPADIDTILGWIASQPASGGSDGVADSDDDDDDDDDDDAESTGEEMPPQACGIADVAPGVESMVEMGDEAGMIPVQIGLIIENNCGCHLAPSADLIMGAPPPAQPPAMVTDFTSLASIQERVDLIIPRVIEPASPMPPVFCSPLHVGALTQWDYDALSTWLEMDAPDGATWTPM